MSPERAPFSDLTHQVGPIGLIVMESCRDLGQRVDKHLKALHEEQNEIIPETFIIKSRCPRFSNGEAKGIIDESVRGKDIYILVDVGNYSLTYNIMGIQNHMSPDDHYADLKRVIQAIGGKAKRINVIMPFLYGGRQHKRAARESLDCASAMIELQNLGVTNIITFDAHDSRVSNAIPLTGFENVHPYYQLMKSILRSVPDIQVDKEHLMMISPDEGGIHRNLYYSTLFGLDLGIFVKRRDFSRIVNGRNPIVAHEFIGSSVKGKDVLIMDDMLSSGDSILDIAKELKRRKANRVFAGVTFAMFTDGIKQFDQFYKKGLIDKIFSTNLTYRRPELAERPWFVEVSMSKYIAKLVDALNYDESISALLDPQQRIMNLLERHNRGEKI
ncbi:MAG: ribose-phosphate pyrophosphokinase [Clostridia bacterium]|nr:ribose-phosphate pyrophosphokinase [Clostridia bacterium]MBP5730841.1 ribose-phosphate pyrophosphokinase [Clostridia bacterium]